MMARASLRKPPAIPAPEAPTGGGGVTPVLLRNATAEELPFETRLDVGSGEPVAGIGGPAPDHLHKGVGGKCLKTVLQARFSEQARVAESATTFPGLRFPFRAVVNFQVMRQAQAVS